MMASEAAWLAKFNSREELEAMMVSILKEGVGGRVVVEWQVGDSSGKKQAWLGLPPSVRRSEVGKALSIKAPDDYPPGTFNPIKRTRSVPADPSLGR